MSDFNPDKLTIEFTDGTTSIKPIIPRRYTLTHSDFTGELFLTIGNEFAWSKINPLRDEVLGEWILCGDTLTFHVYLYIDSGEMDPSISARRVEIFKRELPLALTAIRYGDYALFETYPNLTQVPVMINFRSAYQEFAGQEIWGTFNNFLPLNT